MGGGGGGGGGGEGVKILYNLDAVICDSYTFSIYVDTLESRDGEITYQ